MEVWTPTFLLRFGEGMKKDRSQGRAQYLTGRTQQLKIILTVVVII